VRQKAVAPKQKPSSPAGIHAASLAAEAERIKAIYAHVGDAPTEPGFVTLSNVRMVWDSGDGLSAKTVSLSLDAIAAWWLAPAQAVKGAKDAGGFVAVGVAF
jgi:hypothetical protein